MDEDSNTTQKFKDQFEKSMSLAYELQTELNAMDYLAGCGHCTPEQKCVLYLCVGMFDKILVGLEKLETM